MQSDVQFQGKLGKLWISWNYLESDENQIYFTTYVCQEFAFARSAKIKQT